MIALNIEDIRALTSKLFVGEVFDQFLVKEAQIVTFNSFTIDGRVRKEYYTQEEREEQALEEYSSWRLVKPFCFSLIKGKKLPESFKIVLQLSTSGTKHFVESHQIPMKPEQVTGLYLNVRYEEGRLICVTGSSVQFFTMDKTLDGQWDETVRAFFKKNMIPCTEG